MPSPCQHISIYSIDKVQDTFYLCPVFKMCGSEIWHATYLVSRKYCWLTMETSPHIRVKVSPLGQKEILPTITYAQKCLSSVMWLADGILVGLLCFSFWFYEGGSRKYPMTEVWWLLSLPFLGHQNLHRLICNIIQGDVLSCWVSVIYHTASYSHTFSSWLTHKHTIVSPMDLLLFFCMRQRTIRLRMRRAIKAMAPPVTIPSMGTSTRDCRNSGEKKSLRNSLTFLGAMLICFLTES